MYRAIYKCTPHNISLHCLYWQCKQHKPDCQWKQKQQYINNGCTKAVTQICVAVSTLNGLVLPSTPLRPKTTTRCSNRSAAHRCFATHCLLCHQLWHVCVPYRTRQGGERHRWWADLSVLSSFALHVAVMYFYSMQHHEAASSQYKPHWGKKKKKDDYIALSLHHNLCDTKKKM